MTLEQKVFSLRYPSRGLRKALVGTALIAAIGSGGYFAADHYRGHVRNVAADRLHERLGSFLDDGMITPEEYASLSSIEEQVSSTGANREQMQELIDRARTLHQLGKEQASLMETYRGNIENMPLERGFAPSFLHDAQQFLQDYESDFPGHPSLLEIKEARSIVEKTGSFDLLLETASRNLYPSKKDSSNMDKTNMDRGNMDPSGTDLSIPLMRSLKNSISAVGDLDLAREKEKEEILAAIARAINGKELFSRYQELTDAASGLWVEERGKGHFDALPTLLSDHEMLKEAYAAHGNAPQGFESLEERLLILKQIDTYDEELFQMVSELPSVDDHSGLLSLKRRIAEVKKSYQSLGMQNPRALEDAEHIIGQRNSEYELAHANHRYASLIEKYHSMPLGMYHTSGKKRLNTLLEDFSETRLAFHLIREPLPSTFDSTNKEVINELEKTLIHEQLVWYHDSSLVALGKIGERSFDVDTDADLVNKAYEYASAYSKKELYPESYILIKKIEEANRSVTAHVLFKELEYQQRLNRGNDQRHQSIQDNQLDDLFGIDIWLEPELIQQPQLSSSPDGMLSEMPITLQEDGANGIPSYTDMGSMHWGASPEPMHWGSESNTDNYRIPPAFIFEQQPPPPATQLYYQGGEVIYHNNRKNHYQHTIPSHPNAFHPQNNPAHMSPGRIPNPPFNPQRTPGGSR